MGDKEKKQTPPALNGAALPEGISLGSLDCNYRIASSEYSSAFNRARKLDLTDRNKLWSAVNAKYPKYQILPETNHVSYIKNNILASIYTIGKAASILPTSEKDKEIVQQLNIAIDKIWGQLNVPYYQMRAGERAALLNIGITQVGWDNSVVTGDKDNFEKGRCRLKNINPLKYMRDPYSDSLDTAAYVITWDDYHKSILEANPLYADQFKKFVETHKTGSTETSLPVTSPSDKVSTDATGKKDYYRVIVHWVRKGGKIYEIHTIDNKFVLTSKEIKPNMFPFAELYCNLPTGDLMGVSEPNKIFANTLAYNIMASMIMTAEYKNQRPPKFVNGQSNINLDSFKKHGNEADRTFVVQGDASKAVHYHQFPVPGQGATTSLTILGSDIQRITGVDDRYTGRDTGSILTTGGVNSMLDQVTMIDAPKVSNYEAYCKKLSQLILLNYIEFSAISRKYYVQDVQNPKVWKTVEVDFPSIDKDAIFDYEINVSSELPKNKTAVSNMANKLMEMQMQYSSMNIDVDLITPQEWLMLQQDLPIKEYMLERMGVQRSRNWTELVSQAVTQYAGLIQEGVDPTKAINMTADTLAAQTTPTGGGVEDVLNNIQNGGMAY